MRIAVDTLGFDGLPDQVIIGALDAMEAASKQVHGDSLEILLLGNVDLLNDRKKALKKEVPHSDEAWTRLTSHHCPVEILPNEPAVRAVKTKQDSSLVTGLRLLRSKEVDAFVCAGSTGALVAGSLLTLGRYSGVDRPALAVMLPTSKGSPMILLDAGANAEVKPKNLVQFAIMGSGFAQKVMGCERPTVGLLNVGIEPEKGTDALKQAHALLANAPVNFVGNVEGRDVPNGTVDVLVCDGFVGNVLLKYTEGIGLMLLGLLKKEMNAQSAYSALAALDYREYGGAPLLGVDGVVIKCHGASDARAFSRSISMAARYAFGGLGNVFAEALGDVIDA